jgi:putative ABC transport system permease protein
MATAKNKTFINKIIKHYLKYDKDNPFIFISSLLAFFGIATGVMVLMLAMGMMHGTQKEWQKSLFVMNYPLTIIPLAYETTNDKLVQKLSSKFPELQFSPFYQTGVFSKSNTGIEGFMLYGVNFKQEMRINPVLKKAKENALNNQSKFKLFVGKAFLDKTFMQKGQKLTLNFSREQSVGFGSMPIQKRFLIDASFDSGLNKYDEKILYTTHQAFHKVLKRTEGVYDGIHIYSNDAVNDIKKINIFLKEIGYDKTLRVQGWWEQNASLFAAMEMEKKALFLVLLLIILIASLNIISSLLMTVMSRRAEVALMKTLGATSAEIKSIFFRLGAIIGVSGIVVGTVLGFIGIWVLTTFPIVSLPKDVYGFTNLPIDLTTTDFFSIIIGAFIIVLASALYPAKKASSTNPLTVLRNE